MNKVIILASLLSLSILSGCSFLDHTNNRLDDTLKKLDLLNQKLTCVNGYIMGAKYVVHTTKETITDINAEKMLGQGYVECEAYVKELEAKKK